MSISRLAFFIKETMVGLRRSGLMTVIAIVTIAVTLVILGLFLLISINVGKITDDIVSKLEIRLFMKSNIEIDDIQAFRRKIASIDGVNNVDFVDNDDAWKSFNNSYQHLELDDYITDNPLPHSLVINLEEYQDIKSIVLYLKRFDSLIDDIVYGGELANRVDIFKRFMAISGWTLVGLLVISSLFIIVNTIRLTVIARNEEIIIMRLVGATDLFIKCPFLFEGFIIGIIGAGFATALLYSSYLLIIPKIIKEMPFFPFITSQGSLLGIYIFVIVTGAIIGTFGAYISVTRSLKKG